MIDQVQRTIPGHFHLHVRDVTHLPRSLVGLKLFAKL